MAFLPMAAGLLGGSILNNIFSPQGGAPGGLPPAVPHGIVDGQLDPRYRAGGGNIAQSGLQGLFDFAGSQSPDNRGILQNFLEAYDTGSQRRLGTFQDQLSSGSSGGRRGVLESDLGALEQRAGRDDMTARQGIRETFAGQQAQRNLDRAGTQESLIGRLPGLAAQSLAVPQQNANMFAGEYRKYLDATDRNTGQDWRQMASRDLGRF